MRKATGFLQRSSQRPEKRRQFQVLAEGRSEQPQRTDSEQRVLRPGLGLA
jgi:hypothetical protein